MIRCFVSCFCIYMAGWGDMPKMVDMPEVADMAGMTDM